MSNQNLEETVKRWVHGEKSAFDLMYSDLDRIVEMALKIRHVRSSRGDYEDVRQECWIEVMKNLSRWEPSRGTLKNFLVACCSNRILKFLYRNQKYERFEEVTDTVEISNSQPPIDPHSPELDLQFDPRLRGFRVDYIVRRVFVAIFFEVFETEKKKIFIELLEITRLSKRKLSFLMDYAAVTIRLHLMSRSTCQGV